MRAGNGNMTDWKQKIIAEMNRDKKKTAVLSALVVIAGIFGARLLMTKSAPQATVAAVAPAAAVPAASAFSPPAAAFAAPSARSADEARIRAHMDQLGRTIRRDLFVPDIRHFPPAPAKAKSGGPAKAADTRRSTKEFIEGQAGKLILQSTIVSANPIAIINGQVLRVRDVIEDFTVTKITSRNCVVERDGVAVTLHMKEKP